MIYIALLILLILLGYAFWRTGNVNPPKKNKIKKKHLFQIPVETKDNTGVLKTKEDNASEKSKLKGIIKPSEDEDLNEYLTNEKISNRITKAIELFKKHNDKSGFLCLFFVYDEKAGGWSKKKPYCDEILKYLETIGYKFKFNVKTKKLYVEENNSIKYITYIEYLKQCKKAGARLKTIKTKR